LAASQYGLLPSGTGIARSLRPHPASFAPLLAQQAIQEKNPADAATRLCVDKGRIRAFISRSADAQSSNVVSIDALAIP